MSWLLRDGDVLAAVETGRRGWVRSREGALVLPRPVLVHTIVSRVALDVAWCRPADRGPDGTDEALEVCRTATVGPYRLARPRLAAGSLVVANGGAFERWRLQVGDRLEIREA